ncbi:hypothetical protein FOZ63_003189, partial [Perkinsus olseni]
MKRHRYACAVSTTIFLDSPFYVSKAEFLTSSSDQGRLTGDRELCIKSARTDHIGCVSP